MEELPAQRQVEQAAHAQCGGLGSSGMQKVRGLKQALESAAAHVALQLFSTLRKVPRLTKICGTHRQQCVGAYVKAGTMHAAFL